MIELRALGDLRLHDSEDGREILSVLARAKPPGVLVYLALSPTDVIHSRDKLLELLWPDSRTEKGRNSLSQALHILRSGLGPGVLGTTEDGELFLEADALWSDVAAFDEALAAGHEREALELYRGHLWDGSDFSDCPAFERWLERERQRLRLKAVGAAVTQAQELERDGSFVDAAKWLQQARDWAPFDEIVVQLLPKLLHRLGDRAGAIREYEAFAERLREDYEAEPAPETTALIESVRAREQPNGAVLPSAPVTKHPAAAAVTSVTVEARRSWRTRGRAAAAIIVLGAVTVVGAAIIIRSGRGESPDLDPRLVWVRPFSNETGRPELERLGNMAADWISQGLAETGVVRVLPTLPVGANTEIDPAIPPAQAGSIRNAGTTVTGSFYAMEDSVSFQVQVLESASGEILASVGPVLASPQDPRAGVEELRQRTTGALASAVDPLLASWVAATGPPPSYETYRLFAQGFDAFFGAAVSDRDRRARWLTAADYFRRAADLDSTYALPLLWEVYARFNGGDREGMDSTLDDLTGRRDALTRWEQNLLDAQLALRDDDDLRQYAALSRVVAMTPGSEWNFKLAQVAASLGRFKEAATLLEGVTDQGWLAEWPPYWPLLIQVRHFAGQYERELRDVRAYRAQFPDVSSGRERRPLAALGRVEEALGLARTPGHFVSLVSELFAHGHSEAAQGVIRNHLPKVDLGDPNRADAFRGRWRAELNKAILLFWTGRLTEAEDILRRQLVEEERPRHRVWMLLAEVALAKGDREEAVRIFNHMAELEGPVASGEFTRARILTRLGDRAGAVELLRPALLPQQRPLQLLLRLHGQGPVPQSLADYPPFQKLVGWPPPLPN